MADGKITKKDLLKTKHLVAEKSTADFFVNSISDLVYGYIRG